MSSYDIIRHASHILFRVSCKGLPETAVGKHPACTAAGRLVQNVEIVFANVTGIADRRNGRRDPRLFIQPDGSLANGR